MIKPANDPIFFVIGPKKDKKKSLQINQVRVGLGMGKPISQLKREKILTRDGYWCRGCMAEAYCEFIFLQILLLVLTPKEMSLVLRATLCPFCRIRLFLLDLGLVVNKEKDFDFWCCIYHSGIYRTE